jgi:acyl carrier protein
MTSDELKQTILGVLGRIAPETDMNAIDPEINTRDQLDIDSMDLLNFVIALHKTLAVDIPEADYPKLATINGCVGYLSNRLRSGIMSQ